MKEKFLFIGFRGLFFKTKMRTELLNKFSVIEFNTREILKATEKIKNEFESGKYLSRDEIMILDQFYKLITQTLNRQEVSMYLELYYDITNQKELFVEKRHRKYYPAGTKTFS